jgi:hypothetical protein
MPLNDDIINSFFLPARLKNIRKFNSRSSSLTQKVDPLCRRLLSYPAIHPRQKNAHPVESSAAGSPVGATAPSVAPMEVDHPQPSVAADASVVSVITEGVSVVAPPSNVATLVPGEVGKLAPVESLESARFVETALTAPVPDEDAKTAAPRTASAISKGVDLHDDPPAPPSDEVPRHVNSVTEPGD